MSSNGTRIRVLVVEGDPTVRQGMARLLGHHPMIEVVGSALNGRTAIPKVGSYLPQCVIVNLATSGDETLALLAQLRGSDARGIVIAPMDLAPEVVQQAQEVQVSEVVRCAAVLTSEAAVAGLVQDLLPRVLRIGRSGRSTGAASAPTGEMAIPAAASAAMAAASGSAVLSAPAPRKQPAELVSGRTSPPQVRPAGSSRSLRIVGIGVSTGGPKALTELLPRLPADFPLPIVLVQHMPPKFTQSLAESLDRICKLRVSEARDGDRVESGRVLIAPGGRHLKVVGGEQGEVARLTEDPLECSCRPSVDYLFRSLAAGFGGRVLGVVLTGMGEDGWIGSRLIHEAGGRVLAQSEASCTVYGMPRGPIESGIATAVSLDQMAEAIVQNVRGAPCN